MSFPGEDTGYVSGEAGAILKTTDGGSSWTGREPPGVGELSAVCFVTAQTGYVAGSSGTIMKTMNGGTGIPGITADEEKLRIYPVPTAGMITLIIPDHYALNNTELFLTDMQGRIYRKVLLVSRTITLDLEGLSQGIYLLRISGSSGIITAKVIRR
jgi:hypothetical protein